MVPLQNRYAKRLKQIAKINIGKELETFFCKKINFEFDAKFKEVHTTKL